MNLVDTLISQLDAGLRTVFAVMPAARPTPRPVLSPLITSGASLSGLDKRALPTEVAESMRLMRVNHVGEVCAQALYQGQLLVARDSATRAVLETAAAEERDHLAWCAARVQELGGQTSVLSPLFYAGAWTLGVASGLAGDKWSMGFLVETERQVEAHLESHLDRLPANDAESRAIVTQMRADEIAHGNSGEAHGGMPLPTPIKAAMKLSSKVMTKTTYWV
jgi:3-demethoxyubiquinol 3-hydroxylase